MKRIIFISISILTILITIYFVHNTILTNQKHRGLFSAVENGDSVKIKELLKDKSINVNSLNKLGESPLFTSITRYDSIDIPLELLKSGANPNFLLKDGNIEVSCLYRSVAKENFILEVIKALIESGADVDIGVIEQGLIEETPLMHSCFTGKSDITKILLKNGANPNIRDNKNYTALIYAASSPHYKNRAQKIEVVMLLLKSGANIDFNTIIEGVKKPFGKYIEEKDKEIYDLLHSHVAKTGEELNLLRQGSEGQVEEKEKLKTDEKTK